MANGNGGRYGPGVPAGGGWRPGPVKGAYPKGSSSVPRNGKITGPYMGPQMPNQPVQGPRQIA